LNSSCDCCTVDDMTAGVGVVTEDETSVNEQPGTARHVAGV